MKQLAILCSLIFLVSCSNDTKPSLSTVVSGAVHNNQPRTELAEDVLKHVRYKEKVIVVRNATIIDGIGNPAKERQSLIIKNGLFHSINNDSEIEIPMGATIIDASGKTIIPGIVGVHNHLHIPGFPFIGEVAAKMYLASGVTTIQTCGSASPRQEVTLSEKIAKGETIGPEIFASGPYFTGKGGNPNMIIPKNEEQIRDTIRYWANQGVRWFKVYRHTSPDDLEIIIDEAHEQRAKVTGHLCSITFAEATKLGIDAIEHGLNSTSDFRNNKTFGVCDGTRDYIDNLDISSEKVKSLHRLMIDNNVSLTSTLAIYESSIPKRAFADDRTLNAMSSQLISEYQRRRNEHDQTEMESNRELRLKRIMDFEYQFFKMGGTLTAGVDAGRHVLPGYGDQRNFELLIEAGFATHEAIKIMTSNGGKVLSAPKIGSIEVGKRADFVVLNGNLIQDPTTIKNVEWVFKEGYGYDPNSILKQLKGKFGER